LVLIAQIYHDARSTFKIQELTGVYLRDFYTEFGEVHPHRIKNLLSNKELILETRFYSLMFVTKEFKFINPYPAKVENMVSS